MNYIKGSDYEYIMNKYHDASKPFDGFGRFICHEEIYDDSTGLSAAALADSILENDKQYRHLPRSIRKARAVEFILDHTKIACTANDRFPAICSMDRVVSKKLISVWHNETMHQCIPQTTLLLNHYRKLGIVRIGIDYDHSVPDWERIFQFGFSGLLEESKKAHAQLAASGTLSDEENAFFDSIAIEYRAILRLLHRLAELARVDNPRLSEAIACLSTNPPATFYQCLLTSYIFFILIEHIDCMQARSLSNFDRLFYPYYQRDLENGIPLASIHSDLAYYLLQFTAIGNYWNQPVCLGGRNMDGSTAVNQLSYDFLEVYDNLGIYNPKIQIRFSDSTPKNLILKAMDMIRRGNNSLVFVCEDTVKKALLYRYATLEEAMNFSVHGCYEYSIKGTVPLASTYINLLKPLEYTLNSGCDGVTGELVGLETDTDFSDFEQFYRSYYTQLKFCLDKVMGIVNDITQYNAVINPQPMLSATYGTAITRGLDALHGGAAGSYCNINGGFLANAADSLTAIKELVFDRKEYTLSELREILKNNYEGYEPLRQRILNQIDHFGNNKGTPDHFAREISTYIADYTHGLRTVLGGWVNLGLHVARMSYEVANTTAASPDGRKRGEELSKNASASMGQSREGITAAILSATKLETTKFGANSCLDLGIHPSAVKGEEGLEVMYSLLQTFAARDGYALQINVFDADTLRAAQREPEKYMDLQIRVCGWNVLFNNINKDEQDGFIKQAEALKA